MVAQQLVAIMVFFQKMKVCVILITRVGWVMVESSGKTWSTGEGDGKQIQYSCLENPKNSMKRQKYMTLKDKLPIWVSAQYATGEEQRNRSRRMKRLSQSGNKALLWINLEVKVKCDAVKNNIG